MAVLTNVVALLDYRYNHHGATAASAAINFRSSMSKFRHGPHDRRLLRTSAQCSRYRSGVAAAASVASVARVPFACAPVARASLSRAPAAGTSLPHTTVARAPFP